MKQITRVVVESPLKGATGSVEEYARNQTYARRCARVCLLEGMAPFASHLIYAQDGVLDDLIPEERKLGIEAGLAWSYLADKRIFFVDYGWSSGMLKAKAYYDEFEYPYEERKIGLNPDHPEERVEPLALFGPAAELADQYSALIVEYAPSLLTWLGSDDLNPESVERGRQVRRLLDAIMEQNGEKR